MVDVKKRLSHKVFLLKLSEEQLTEVLLYNFSQLDQNRNRKILNSSIKDIVESKRFESFESRGKYLFFKLPTILKTLVHSKY